MTIKAIYRAFGAALVWAVLAIQYVLITTNGLHANIGAATISYFGYFTILTNFLVAFALTAPFLGVSNKIRQFFKRPAVRAAIALYILVVAVVYHLLLAHLWEPQGWQKFTDLCLHTIIPMVYLIDWIVFADKRPMRYARIPYWVIYPAGYGLFIILKGAIAGTYPYPFLNVAELGLSGVMINMVGFTTLYAVGGAVFISLGRLLSREVTIGETA